MLEGYGIHALIWDAADERLGDFLVAFSADATGHGLELRVRQGGRELLASGRICAEAKYVGLGFTPWDSVTGPTHREHLTSARFAADMGAFSYLNFQYLFYSCTNLAGVAGLCNLSGVRSMRFAFASAAVVTLDFRGFDPSALTDLYYAFSGCKKLATIYADASWSLPSSGVSGSQCFYNCSTALVGGAGTIWARMRTWGQAPLSHFGGNLPARSAATLSPK